MSQRSVDDDSIKRRRILKLTGAAVVGGTAMTGVASANAPHEVRFCGCTQVCVDTRNSSDPFWIITAEDVDGDFVYDCEGPYYGDRCIIPGDKVIAIVDGAENVICNPNNCAQMVRGRTGGFTVSCPRGMDPVTASGCDCDLDLDPGVHEGVCRGLTDGSGNPISVPIRTNQCKPPSEWD